MENTKFETLLATGASETATGSRLAMRGMIWMAYAYHQECNLGDMKPTLFKRHTNAALLAIGRGKGEASTKSNQACAIGEAFPAMFTAELVSEYADVSQFIQACFNVVQARGASSVLRLVDLAKHGDADHTAKMKDQKKAVADAEKAEAMDLIEETAQKTEGLPSLDLDMIVTATQSKVVEPEVVQNSLAGLSDSELNKLGKAVAAEIAARAQQVAKQKAA